MAEQLIDRFWEKLGDEYLSDSQFDLAIRLMMEETPLGEEQIIDLTSSFSENLQVNQESTETSSDDDVSRHNLVIEEESEPEDSSDSGEEPEYEQDRVEELEEQMERVRMERTTPKEEGEPSGRAERKRKTTEDRYFPTQPRSIPKKDGGQSGIGEFLNLDCADNQKYLIDRWAAEIRLIVQTNPEAYQDPKTILLLMENKSYGIAKQFIKSTQWNTLAGDVQDNVVSALYVMFLGLDYTLNQAKEQEKERDAARKRMWKLQLCDICKLKDFNCDYEENIHKLEAHEFPGIIAQYLSKIPHVSEKVLQRYKNEAVGPLIYSFGFAKRLVQEELSKICELTRVQKKLKKFNKKCCKGVTEKPTEYGCSPETKKRYKKKKKYRAYKAFKPYKKKKKFRPGKYFKPKKKKGSKEKFCPQGKKNCRCWICSVEGHYANECPNRQKKAEKTLILQEAQRLGLEPIEDPYDGPQEIFILEYQEELRTDEEDSDGETTVSTDESSSDSD